MTALPPTHTVLGRRFPRLRLRRRPARHHARPSVDYRPAPMTLDAPRLPPEPPEGATLAELHAHVNAIAQTFAMSDDGHFEISKRQYDAYCQAVNRAKDARAAARYLSTRP